MNTSDYNSTLQPGEQPVGSGARQPVAEPSSSAPAEETPRPADTPAPETGLSYEDAWDKGPGSTPPDLPAAPYALDVPGVAAHLGEWVERDVKEFAPIAHSLGLNKRAAQEVLGNYATTALAEKPPAGGYTVEGTTQTLLREWGTETNARLDAVFKFTEKRPALAKWLNETGAGNAPEVVRTLAAIASDQSLLTPAGAKKFIAGLSKNEKYVKGDKFEVAKAKLAFAIDEGK
jgi:hypothetical protein